VYNTLCACTALSGPVVSVTLHCQVEAQLSNGAGARTCLNSHCAEIAQRHLDGSRYWQHQSESLSAARCRSLKPGSAAVLLVSDSVHPVLWLQHASRHINPFLHMHALVELQLVSSLTSACYTSTCPPQLAPLRLNLSGRKLPTGLWHTLSGCHGCTRPGKPLLPSLTELNSESCITWAALLPGRTPVDLEEQPSNHCMDLGSTLRACVVDLGDSMGWSTSMSQV